MAARFGALGDENVGAGGDGKLGVVVVLHLADHSGTTRLGLIDPWSGVGE